MTNVTQGREYKITGNTYSHASKLRALGARFVDESEDIDSGVPASGARKFWLLDLTSVSKTKFQRDMANDIFHLGRSGVRFEVA